MMSSILSSENLIDNQIDIKFDHKKVTITCVINVQTTYTDTGVDSVIYGDVSPDENGKIRRRSLEVSEHFTESSQNVNSYMYKCDYDDVIIHSNKLTSLTLIRHSNNPSYFNRLSQRD